MDDQERWYLDNLPLEGAVIADVGANVGYYTMLAAQLVGEEGRVYAIEASPSIFVPKYC